MSVRMKGITCCGDCVYYDWKKRKCKRCNSVESDPRSSFYDDCPLPDVAVTETTEWIDDGVDFVRGEKTKRWKCVKCGYVCYGDGHPRMNYCPECGREAEWDDGQE